MGARPVEDSWVFGRYWRSYVSRIVSTSSSNASDFVTKADGAGLERRCAGEPVGVAAEGDHARGMLECEQAARGGRAVEHRHRHVHQDDLGLGGLRQPHSLAAGRGRADDLEAPVLVEDGGEGVREHAVVVDHEHANRLCPGHRAADL